MLILVSVAPGNICVSPSEHHLCLRYSFVGAERLAMIRQQRAEAAKKREEEKAGM